MSDTDRQDLLSLFSAPIRAWFDATYGQPTPPQAQGWPAIGRGEHTLILAPTGSGKTFAAFLSGIDRLYRELTAAEASLRQRGPTRGAHRLRVAAQGAEQRHLSQPALAAGVHQEDRTREPDSLSRIFGWRFAPAIRPSGSGRRWFAARRTS